MQALSSHLKWIRGSTGKGGDRFRLINHAVGYTLVLAYYTSVMTLLHWMFSVDTHIGPTLCEIPQPRYFDPKTPFAHTITFYFKIAADAAS